MRRDTGLIKDHAAFRVETNGKESGKTLAFIFRQGAAREGEGDGVEVDYGEDEICGGGRSVLEVFPLLEGAEVVSQVGHAGWLDTGEDCFGGGFRGRGGG